MKTSPLYYTNNNNLVNIIETKKQYERHKFELENIKKSQSHSTNQRSLYSPERKFHDLHDSMRGVFAQSRDYNSRQKMQNILVDNKKILNKIKDIQKGEQDSIARQFMDQQPRKMKKRRRTKSRKLQEEIQSIAALLEQEDKQLMDNYSSLINAVDSQRMNSNQGSSYQYNGSYSQFNNKGINNPPPPNILLMRKSLNMEFRKEEQRQIAQQNTQLINKIVNVQANINHKDLEKDFRQNQKYKKNVRKQSKTRMQFVNNFLQTRIQRSNSGGTELKHEKFFSSKHHSFTQQSPQLNQQNYLQPNGIQEKNQSPPFNIQFVNPNHESMHSYTVNVFKENLLNPVSEFTILDSKGKNSPTTKKRSILTKTEPDEVENLQQSTLEVDSKSQSIQNLQQHRKQRSHSLKAGSTTLFVSPYHPPRIPILKEEQTSKTKVPLNGSKLIPPTQNKIIQSKFKQQTWKRNSNLFQIQPPRSVSALSNLSPSRNVQTENEGSPSASNFRNNRILSPRGYKYRTHTLHMKRPLSQIENHSFVVNNAFQEQSFLIQKSLSLIESDFEEKQESFNEVEYKSLKQKCQQNNQKAQAQLQRIDGQHGQSMNNKQIDLLQTNQLPTLLVTQPNSHSYGKQNFNEINARKCNESSKDINDKNKENLSDGSTSLKTKETLETSQLNQNTNQGQGINVQKNEQKEKLMQGSKDFQLQLNDIILRSPNQIQQTIQNVTSQNQEQRNVDNLQDKEKYLLINSKQRFFRPGGLIPKQQQIAPSSKLVANYHTEPVNFNLQQQQQLLDSAAKNNSRTHIQSLMAKTCFANPLPNEKSFSISVKDKQFQTRKLNSPFIKSSQRCHTQDSR